MLAWGCSTAASQCPAPGRHVTPCPAVPQVAPSDFVAIALALAATTAELQSGHSIFTLNNLVACIIATEVRGGSSSGAGDSQLACMPAGSDRRYPVP